MGLQVNHVSKLYGDKAAVDNISFSIDKPSVFGLLGTNGAGKTTTIRMLLGILKKSSGDITWNGQEMKRKHVRLGYLPEERGIYPKTKVYEQLLYFARLQGMKKKEAKKSIDYWLKRLEIEEYKHMTAEKLSKGNQQKVQFVTAIMHNPEVIVLDEPFSGLDPVNTELLKNVILELVEQGKYIIMSSHQMTSIEEFCTDVLILNKGKTILQGNLKQIKSSYKATKIEVSTAEDITGELVALELPILSNKDKEYVIGITDEGQGKQLLEYLVSRQITVEKFELKRPSLHDIFIEKVEETKG